MSVSPDADKRGLRDALAVVVGIHNNYPVITLTLLAVLASIACMLILSGRGVYDIVPWMMVATLMVAPAIIYGFEYVILHLARAAHRDPSAFHFIQVSTSILTFLVGYYVWGTRPGPEWTWYIVVAAPIVLLFRYPIRWLVYKIYRQKLALWWNDQEPVTSDTISWATTPGGRPVSEVITAATDTESEIELPKYVDTILLIFGVNIAVGIEGLELAGEEPAVPSELCPPSETGIAPPRRRLINKRTKLFWGILGGCYFITTLVRLVWRWVLTAGILLPEVFDQSLQTYQLSRNIFWMWPLFVLLIPGCYLIFGAILRTTGCSWQDLLGASAETFRHLVQRIWLGRVIRDEHGERRHGGLRRYLRSLKRGELILLLAYILTLVTLNTISWKGPEEWLWSELFGVKWEWTAIQSPYRYFGALTSMLVIFMYLWLFESNSMRLWNLIATATAIHFLNQTYGVLTCIVASLFTTVGYLLNGTFFVGARCVLKQGHVELVKVVDERTDRTRYFYNEDGRPMRKIEETIFFPLPRIAAFFDWQQFGWLLLPWARLWAECGPDAPNDQFIYLKRELSFGRNLRWLTQRLPFKGLTGIGPRNVISKMRFNDFDFEIPDIWGGALDIAIVAIGDKRFTHAEPPVAIPLSYRGAYIFQGQDWYGAEALRRLWYDFLIDASGKIKEKSEEYKRLELSARLRDEPEHSLRGVS